MWQSAFDCFESMEGRWWGLGPGEVGCGFFPWSRDLAWLSLGFHLPGQCVHWAEGSCCIKWSFAPWQGCLLHGLEPHRKSPCHLAPGRAGSTSAAWNLKSIVQMRSARTTDSLWYLKGREVKKHRLALPPVWKILIRRRIKYFRSDLTW